MKKQLVLLVLLMGLSAASFAQDKKMMLGLDLGFSSNDNQSSFGLGPNFGYWLSDNMALVVGIDFASTTNKLNNDLKTTTFGAGAELRYGWNVGDMTFLYLAPGFSYSKDTQEQGAGLPDEEDSEFNIRIVPGVTYKIADAWSIDARFGSLGYNSTKHGDGDSFGTFGLNLNMSSIGFGLWYHF